jgi:hypothetical protein
LNAGNNNYLNAKIILVKLSHGLVKGNIHGWQDLKRLELVEFHFNNCYVTMKITQGKIT